MNTKHEVMMILDEFIDCYQGKHSIYAVSIGPGPSEYTAYGKCKRDNKAECTDYALHVFTKLSTEMADTVDIPMFYKGVRTMLFFEQQ